MLIGCAFPAMYMNFDVIFSLASMLQEARHFQAIYLLEQRFDAYVVMNDDNKGFHDHVLI